MLVLLTCTLLVVGADHVRRRHHHGAARGPRPVLAARGQRPGAGRRAIGADRRRGWCPQFRAMQARIDAVNRVLREQITGIRVVRAFVREPRRARAVRRRQRRRSPTTALRVGRLQALMFPTVMLVLNVSSVAVLWFGAPPHRRRADADRRADRVPQLPDADPDVGDDGHLHARDGPARRGLRRAASTRCSTPSRRCVAARRRRCTELTARGERRAARRRVPLPGRRASRCSRDIIVHAPSPARPPRSSAAPARARRRCCP